MTNGPIRATGSPSGGAAVTRDANGNTTGQGTWTYTYDKHNRVTKAYNSGTLKVTYTYNGLGQRVKKAVAAPRIVRGTSSAGATAVTRAARRPRAS